MRTLLQKVDSMPDRAPWMEQWITFKDRPGEKHLVQYRDIIIAMKALLGNPAHADKIVYRPSHVFTDGSRKGRVSSGKTHLPCNGKYVLFHKKVARNGFFGMFA